MTNLLVINSSPMGENSISRQINDFFVEQLKSIKGEVEVTVRDIAKDHVPHLDDEILGAFFTEAEARNDTQKAHINRSDTLISEFKEADVIVIGVPMHNFSIPSTLKSYLDHLARAGETFQYTENGPQGLVADKPVYVIGTRGGNYGPESGLSHLDHALPYMKVFLNFVGIQDVHLLQANGLAMGEEVVKKELAQIQEQITSLIAA